MWFATPISGRTSTAADRRRAASTGLAPQPWAIVAARKIIEGREVVTVVPITHTPPTDLLYTVELPPALKVHLGLDDLPSWVIVSEVNAFLWPGPDLRPVSRSQPDIFAYGMLPPRFFTHLRDRILQAHLQRKLNRVERTE